MKCGVVDLGSNTVRLSIYQWEGRSFKELLNEKIVAGLADYVENGALTPRGITATCGVLSAYRALLDNFGISEMHVFATASLRNISNTAEAVAAIRGATGITVEVLSGEDEAMFSFRGAVAATDSSGGLLADIGGGSVELVHYENRAIVSSCSLPVGSLSLFSGFVKELFPTPDEAERIRSYVDTALTKAKTAGVRCQTLCGVGGTIRAVSRLSGDLFHNDSNRSAMTGDEVLELCDSLLDYRRRDLHRILHTVPDRVHTILPGLMILRAVVEAYGVKAITASSGGVREGYFMERIL